MKKNLFYAGALVIGLTVATGCSNEENLGQNKGNLTVVEATIDNNSARTSVNELYQVVWSAGDAFTVFGDSKKGDMTLQGNGGTTTGSFAGENITLTNGDVALFPAIGNDATTMTYTFKDAYTDTETDAPLYGTYNGTSFSFSPLSAVIRVNASGLTAGTQYVLTLTSTGEQALTGDATVNNGALTAPTGEGKTITVTLTPAAGVTSLTFDAPIPAQTYTSLTITLKAGNNDATTLRTLTNFTAVAGKLYEATEKVTTAQDLQTALNKGGNVDIQAPITLEEDLEVTENTILDLNNQTLTTGDKTITVAEGKILTIQNSASLARSASEPSITGSGDIITASNNSTIIIGEGVNLTSTDNCCVFVPYGVSGVTITTAANLTSQGDYAAIQANGNATDVTVNVIGGTISSKCEGVYFPCTTNLNISGGTITGTTAVYHKSGNLTISGGALKATGAKTDYVHNGNGCNATGDALVIEACDYPGGVPVVSITGGEFISENAKAIGYYKQSTDYKLANEFFITGGTFSDASACYYLGTNADVTVNMVKDYTGGGFKTKSGQKVTLNIADGVTYTATSPLVGSTNTQTLGFQFLQGSTVSIKGGVITSSAAKMLINNYADLTLNGVTLNPSIPVDNEETTDVDEGMKNQYYYVLSNNCGEVNIENTIITAPTELGNKCPGAYAFDVCKYASYPNVTVNVKSGTINGNVEYTGTNGGQQKLVITGGTFNGNLVVADTYSEAASAGISITGATFGEGVTGWATYINAN